jgi:hypothetical protein
MYRIFFPLMVAAVAGEALAFVHMVLTHSGPEYLLACFGLAAFFGILGVATA